MPGDGERKKRAREVPGLFGAGPEERELSFSPGWGVKGDSCVLCSGPRC